jgi:hypothetical protein
MIDQFIRAKQLIKGSAAINPAKSNFEKSRPNLTTMEILSNMNKHEKPLAAPIDDASTE